MDSPQRPSNGWNRYEYAVLEKLKAHEKKLDAIELRMSERHEKQLQEIASVRASLGREIATLQSKAAVAGAVGGSVLSVVGSLIFKMVS